MASLKRKEYMYSFVEGGWNTVWAKTIRGARKLAVEKWKEHNDLTVDETSVHIATKEGMQAAMSLFW